MIEEEIDYWGQGYLASKYELEVEYMPTNKHEAEQFAEGFKVGLAGKNMNVLTEKPNESWEKTLKRCFPEINKLLK